MVDSDVPKNIWPQMAGLLFVVVGAIFVLTLVRIAGKEAVHILGAQPEIQGQSTLYFVKGPRLATSTLPTTGTVQYGVRNGTKNPYIYDIVGRIASESQNDVVFERREYLMPGEERTWNNEFILEHATGSMAIIERSTNLMIESHYAPPN